MVNLKATLEELLILIHSQAGVVLVNLVRVKVLRVLVVLIEDIIRVQKVE